jgi:16S rRNA (guanine527-N7)-methyltransferase
LLTRWNDAFNLVSRRDVSRLVPRHVLDSLSLLPHLVGRRVLDLGTGAGLPGLPLAIAAPAIAFTLLDRSERRLKFARQAVIELELANVEVECRSLDEFRPDVAFDTVVVRAVGTPRRLWRTLERVLAPTGVALFQSADPDALELPGGVVAKRHRIDIPGLAEPHWIVVLEREPVFGCKTVLERKAGRERA